MYELTVERTFCAAHAIMMRGEREPLHGHNWHVTVTVVGTELDEDGLLCDFHELETAIDGVIGPLQNRNLNDLPAFAETNPTAEHVAQHIATALTAALPNRATLSSVSVTEAPGCKATYRPT